MATSLTKSFPEPRKFIIAGGQVLNVFTGELEMADIVVEDGRIAALVAPGSVASRRSAMVFAQGGTATPHSPARGGAAGGSASSAGSSTSGNAASSAPAAAAGKAEGGIEVIAATDRVIVPGYVEPHAHLGLLAEPVATLEQMAVTGTTSVVADTYAFMVVLSDDELADLLDRFRELPINLRWFLVPHARSFVEGEQELFSLERLEKFLPRPDVVALGEFTRWPAVEQGDPDLLSKIERARSLGKRIEGHCAGASLRRLQRLVKHGVTSDHEAITADQVLDRLRVGLYTMLRHSSLRPDLPALVEAVKGNLSYTNRLMLTADGPTPPWMAAHGYLDHLVRLAMEGGIEPGAAYRMATLNPAMYYGIEDDVGSVSPGRRADLLILRDLSDPTPEIVVSEGRIIAQDGELTRPFARVPWDTYVGFRRPPGVEPAASLFQVDLPDRVTGPEAATWTGAGTESEAATWAEAVTESEAATGTGAGTESEAATWAGAGTESEAAAGTGPESMTGSRVADEGGVERDHRYDHDDSLTSQPSARISSLTMPTLDMAHTVILRGGAGEGPAVQVALYDWHGRWITRAFVTGFADRLGGFASSYSPAFQTTVVGQNPEDMALAAQRVIERRGGMCLVEDGRVLWELPLEKGGMFTDMRWAELVSELEQFERLMRERGYRHGELLYSLFFFGFDSLPDYRVTIRGVWDVRRHRVVTPPERLVNGSKQP